jgi:hypothetical protein
MVLIMLVLCTRLTGVPVSEWHDDHLRVCCRHGRSRHVTHVQGAALHRLQKVVRQIAERR